MFVRRSLFEYNVNVPLMQARATFFGRGPHQYFDRMSGAIRPESFTSMIVKCYSMNS